MINYHHGVIAEAADGTYGIPLGLRFAWWTSDNWKAKPRFKLGYPFTVDEGAVHLSKTDGDWFIANLDILLAVPHLNNEDISSVHLRANRGVPRQDSGEFIRLLREDLAAMDSAIASANALIAGRVGVAILPEDIETMGLARNHRESLLYAISAEESHAREVARRAVEQAEKKRQRAIMTYFIHSAKTDAVKIGISSNVPKRLSSLQTSNADHLKLLAAIPGDKEAELHERFAHVNIAREWFAAPEVMQWLAQQNLA